MHINFIITPAAESLLRDAAMGKGMSPSSYARQVLAGHLGIDLADAIPKKGGARPGSGPKRRFTIADVTRARRWRANGMTIADIASRLAAHPSSISDAVYRAGGWNG